MSPPSAATTATGARWPKRLRNVRPAVPSVAHRRPRPPRTRSPPSSRRWEGRWRHTSTNDGAASAAGSRMVPVPRTRSRAAAHRGVGHQDHQADVRAGLAHPHGDLEGGQLVGLDADDRLGPVQSGSGQPVPDPGAPADEGHAPSLHHCGQTGLGGVVDDHDRHPALVELFDRPQAHAVEPADDDVAVAPPGSRRRRSPPGAAPLPAAVTASDAIPARRGAATSAGRSGRAWPAGPTTRPGRAAPPADARAAAATPPTGARSPRRW